MRYMTLKKRDFRAAHRHNVRAYMCRITKMLMHTMNTRCEIRRHEDFRPHEYRMTGL